MKNQILRKLPLLCLAVLLSFCMILSGCAGRTVLTAEDFKAACDAAGYTTMDTSLNYDPAYVTTAIIGMGEDYSVGFYTFVSASDAKTNYAQFLGDARTGTAEPGDEKFVDSPEYNRYYVSTEHGTILLYRNGTTMLYISGADNATLNSIIENLDI